MQALRQYWVVGGVVYFTRQAAQEAKVSETDKKTKK